MAGGADEHDGEQVRDVAAHQSLHVLPPGCRSAAIALATMPTSVIILNNMCILPSDDSCAAFPGFEPVNGEESESPIPAGTLSGYDSQEGHPLATAHHAPAEGPGLRSTIIIGMKEQPGGGIRREPQHLVGRTTVRAGVLDLLSADVDPVVLVSTPSAVSAHPQGHRGQDADHVTQQGFGPFVSPSL